jgi:hypothetical protein
MHYKRRSKAPGAGPLHTHSQKSRRSGSGTGWRTKLSRHLTCQSLTPASPRCTSWICFHTLQELAFMLDILVRPCFPCLSLPIGNFHAYAIFAFHAPLVVPCRFSSKVSCRAYRLGGGRERTGVSAVDCRIYWLVGRENIRV